MFGESRPEWRGAASSRFVEEVLVQTGRPKVLNVDVTVVGLRPRLAPYREAIRARIAELLGITVGQVSVKASSGNGLTDFGKGDGVAASVILLAEIGS